MSGARHGQDGKFDFSSGRIVNRISGEVIPDDEPVFIFRARDHHARKAIEFYQTIVEDEHHKAAIAETVEAFEVFAEMHPERMKEPGITRHFQLTGQRLPRIEAAARALLGRYVVVVENWTNWPSSWDPEGEPVVIEMRAALEGIAIRR